MDSLEQSRKRIDEIDSRIASLFELRMEECREVARIKKENGLAVTDGGREAEVIQKNAALVKDDVIREYYVSFEKDVMEISKKYQRRLLNGMKVAYCGIPGAFAQVAAEKMFPGAELESFQDFTSAYRSCENGDCDCAVLPFENSSSGEVAQVTDLMFAGSLHINQVCELEVVQNLLGCEGASPETVKEVVSHPQALAQCADYIARHSFRAVDYPNTASAAKMVAERNDPALGAIGSRECAELYGLKVLESHINPTSLNSTRFAAFSRSAAASGKKGATSHFILMFTVSDEAGSLAKTLNIIGIHGFNMRCLRSRPMKGLMWNYYFFLELEGDIDSPDGESMMIELGTLCNNLKVVGKF